MKIHLQPFSAPHEFLRPLFSVRIAFFGNVSHRRNYGVLQLKYWFKHWCLAAATYKSEYEEKHVNEVQVEFERSHNAKLYLSLPIHAHLRGHAADTLRIISR